MREDTVSGAAARLEAVQTRIGIGQSLARDRNEVNKASHPSSAFAEYRCECASRICDQLVPLSVDEYEEVRRDARHFVVARGHVDPRVEFVVRETARYQVVQKFGVAANVAARLDPHRRDGHFSELAS